MTWRPARVFAAWGMGSREMQALPPQRRARAGQGSGGRTTLSRQREAAALRVIAWPAFLNRGHNPYNSLLYDGLTRLGVQVEDFLPHRLLFGRYDIWHLHWPEAILNLRQPWKAVPLAFILRVLLRAARARGIKIVWTVHNLRSHEGLYPRVESRLWEALLAGLDGYIALTEDGKARALRRYPALRGRPGFVIPHGPYRAVYPDTLDRDAARARLDLPPEARVFLSLGQIRSYKNVPHLIHTFRALPDPALRLVIAGRPHDTALAAAVRTAAGNDPRIHLHLGFVPDDAIQVFLRAADLVVLPYREVLNSGSAILALSFARPILVPAQGALRELQRTAGAEWVHTYAGPLRPRTLHEAMRDACRTPRDPARLFLDRSWEVIAQQTLNAYRAVSV